jgi:transposase
MQGTGMVRREDGNVTEIFEWFVGVDWGSAAHDLCVVDATGAVRGRRRVPHTAEEVHAAVTWLRALTGVAPAQIAIAIETPRGVLVDTLIELGFAVFAINPKQLDRFRDRFSPSGAKDDTRDAQVLSDALRTDARAFRRVRPDEALIIELREVTRLREDLLEDEGRLANRLRDQLLRVDAGWLEVVPAADEPWLWTVLIDHPDPATWSRLTRRQLTRVLYAHRLRRVTAEDLLPRLRAARLTVAAGVTDAVAARIAAVAAQVRLVHEQRLQAERRIDRLLARLAPAETAETELGEHHDVEILLSLPGVGRMVTATMLTEATGPLADRDYATLRAHAGTAPVTRRSGRRLHTVHMRYACKGRLRQAMYHWARTSIQRDAATRRYYEALRTRGHHYARALRSVADRWMRILVAMLRSRTLYDATRFATADSTTD